MQVSEVMTKSPTCCTRETSLQDVAKHMVSEDCGAIPVVESQNGQKLAGIVTDRDIVVRAVAEGKNPLEMTAENCMSSATVTTSPDASVEECCQKMETNQIRRIPVVESDGTCCGIVAQADIATKASKSETGEVVGEISK